VRFAYVTRVGVRNIEMPRTRIERVNATTASGKMSDTDDLIVNSSKQHYIECRIGAI
jgi:hypothetical protein